MREPCQHSVGTMQAAERVATSLRGFSLRPSQNSLCSPVCRPACCRRAIRPQPTSAVSRRHQPCPRQARLARCGRCRPGAVQAPLPRCLHIRGGPEKEVAQPADYQTNVQLVTRMHTRPVCLRAHAAASGAAAVGCMPGASPLKRSFSRSEALSAFTNTPCSCLHLL